MRRRWEPGADHRPARDRLQAPRTGRAGTCRDGDRGCAGAPERGPDQAAIAVANRLSLVSGPGARRGLAHDGVEPGIGAGGADALRLGVVRRSAGPARAAPATGTDAQRSRVINQQRALCLLALGRAQDAEHAIAAVVQADPTYRPDEASASPRVRNAFRDVRVRLLPGIVQAKYGEARASTTPPRRTRPLPRSNACRAGCRPGSGGVTSSRARRSEDARRRLRETLLGRRHPPTASRARTSPAGAYRAASRLRRHLRWHERELAPVTVRQDLPRWSTGVAPPRARPARWRSSWRKAGRRRATLTQAIAGFFDRQVLDATKNWRYQPANVNGQPVRFKKTIKITFQ